jgi:RNA polymerase sigma factor (sigma-70 family)
VKKRSPNSIISQYIDMQEEIRRLKQSIKKSEDALEQIVDEGTVVDKVSGGLGGIQGFKIEGFPVAQYERRRKLLREKIDNLHEQENELLEMSNKIDEIAKSAASSRERIIIRAIAYDGKTQQEIADELHIDQSLVSKTISKYHL